MGSPDSTIGKEYAFNARYLSSFPEYRLSIPVFLGFPRGLAGREAACNVGDLDSIPGLEDPLKKGKATHSGIVAFRVPWTLQSTGLQRVRHD